MAVGKTVLPDAHNMGHVVFLPTGLLILHMQCNLLSLEVTLEMAYAQIDVWRTCIKSVEGHFHQLKAE